MIYSASIKHTGTTSAPKDNIAIAHTVNRNIRHLSTLCRHAGRENYKRYSAGNKHLFISNRVLCIVRVYSFYTQKQKRSGGKYLPPLISVIQDNGHLLNPHLFAIYNIHTGLSNLAQLAALQVVNSLHLFAFYLVNTG